MHEQGDHHGGGALAAGVHGQERVDGQRRPAGEIDDLLGADVDAQLRAEGRVGVAVGAEQLVDGVERRHPRCLDQPRLTSAPRPTQLVDEALVAAVDVVGVGHDRLAVGPERGHDERRAGPDVVGPHRRARERGLAPHDGVVALGADVGAHAHELVDVAEPARRRCSR